MSENHDLFMVMLNLSQINKINRIKSLFCEIFNEYYKSLKLEYSESPDTSADENFKLQKNNTLYGYITIKGELDKYSQVEQSNLRNAIGLLCIILENKTLQESLSRRTISLKQDLEQNEKLLANIMKTVPDIIYIYDLQTGENLYINEAYDKSFDISAAKFENNDETLFMSLVHPDDRMKVADHHSELKRAPYGSVIETEYRLKDKEGQYRWLLSKDLVYKKSPNGFTEHILGCASDISVIKSTQSRLRNTIKDKELLLKEVHHRVKNNLAIIGAFLSLQSEQYPDESIKHILEDNISRIQTMALVHEELYNNENISDINFRRYIINLIQNIQGSFNTKHINIEYDIEPIRIDMSHIIPLGLIINEVTVNSFKFAFQGKSDNILKISLKNVQANNYVLEISDNGPGIRDDDYDAKKGRLGFQIIEALTEQLGGISRFVSKDGLHYHLELQL